MSWLDKLLRRPALTIKESAVGRLLHLQTLGRAAWTPRDYASLAREAYQQNAVAYRCVRMIAEAAAGVTMCAYDGDTEKEDHPVLALLRKPNPFQSGDELLDTFFSFFEISGNTYLEAVMLDGTIRELFVLRPDRMKVVPGPNGYPVAYEYTVSGQTVRYPVDVGRQLPILHMRKFNPLNDWYGMAPVEAGAFAIDVHNAAGSFNKALLDNQARPSGALVYAPPNENADSSLTDKQFSRLKDELAAQYQGAANAGRPLVLDGGLDWKEMGVTPKDMEFVEGKREAAREIALSFGVPPMLLGIPGDNTYSNYSEANRAFYRQTVLPLANKACEALTNFLAPTFGEAFRLEVDDDDLPALDDERKALWERLNAAKFLTINEKREAVGYEPYEPKDTNEDGTGGEAVGDVILVSSSEVPLLTTDIVQGGADPNDTSNDQSASEEEDADGKPAADQVGADAEDGAAAAAGKPSKRTGRGKA